MPSSVQDFRITFDQFDALRMTCQNVNCEAERKGWVTVLDVQGDEKAAISARYIEQDSGKRFIKLHADDALGWFDKHAAEEGVTLTPRLHDMIAAMPRTFVIYLFFPGQSCFKPHLDREVVFTHEVNGRRRVHARPADWNEHFNEEAYRVNRERQKG